MSLARILICLLALAAVGCQSEVDRAAEHMSRGEALLEEEKWDEATIEYKNATKLVPNDAKAHYGLAKAYLGKKEARNAYWELQETVRLDPSNVQARIDHGEFLLFGRNEELEQAVTSADAIIAAEPQRWEGYALKGRALAALGRHDEAGESFKRGVETAGFGDRASAGAHGGAGVGRFRIEHHAGLPSLASQSRRNLSTIGFHSCQWRR